MNYKKRDDELIRRQKEAQRKYRESVTVKQNAINNKVYSKQALEDLAKGKYKKVPELKKQEPQNKTPNTPTTSAPEQPKPKVNLRDKGYSGSTRNDQIDFDYVMENDKTFGRNGMLNLLQSDQEHRRKYGRNDTGNEMYYNRFGMSKNEVLDQYERYRREKHPILSGLEDIATAPDRAIAGAIGTAARTLFPNSDLDRFANSDFIQSRNKEVQRKRDYTYDSDKLTQGQKAAAKTVLEGGDFLSNMALAGLVGGGGAIGSAGAGVGASFEPAKWLMPTLNGILGYGSVAENTRHDLEKQGVDSDTANQYANAQGLVWGGLDALTAGAGSKAGAAAKIAGNSAIQTAVKSAAKGFGIGVGKQAASEIANRLILGDQGSFNADVQNYMAEGLDEEQATTRAFGNVLGRAASSGVLGGILGGVSSLIGSGINNAANKAAGTTLPSTVDTDGLNEYFVGPERIGQNPIGIGQNDVTPYEPTTLPSLTGNTALALPEKQLPNTVIPMTGTQGSIQLPDLTRPSTLNPLTGTALTEAKTQRTDIDRQLRAKNKEILAQQDVVNNAAKKNKKAESNKLKELKQQAADLQEQKKEITRQINGRSKPIKELLSKEDYDSIFSERTGLKSYINLATKFAGDTPEAKQVANEVKQALEKLVETGNSWDFGDLANKATQLHDLASQTRADYVTKNGLKYTFDDTFGEQNLIDRVVGNNALVHSVPDLHKGLNVDNDGIVPYNVDTKGEITNGTIQTSRGNDGTGSEGILRDVRPEGRMGEIRFAEGVRGREYLPADRVSVANNVKKGPSIFDDASKEVFNNSNIEYNDMYDNTDSDLFSKALATAIKNNPNGAAVDFHTAEEIQDILNRGGKTFLTADGTAGGAVDNGNLTAVFKDKKNNDTPRMGSVISLAGVKNGAYKGDCFGLFLVNTYSRSGFEPVARMNYSYGYNPDMDAQVRDQLAKGIINKEPDVYALKLIDGYDYDTALKNYNKAHRWGQEELDALPLFDDYDEMLEYRDSLIKQPTSEVAFSDGQLTLEEVRALQKVIDEGKFEKNIFDLDLQYFAGKKANVGNSYWLRVLGDADFLEQEAKKAGVEPAVLKVYASANLGYDDFPVDGGNEVPPTNNGNGGNVPPKSSIYDDMMGHTKTSKAYTNTGRRGGGWTEDEYDKYTDESMFQYFDKSEKASVDEANTMRSSEGRNAFKNRVMSKERLTGAEIDGLMMEWRELTAEARALEAQGKDASAITKEGIKIFRKIQSQSSDNAQALQALQKWSRNTPEGMLAEAENVVNGKTEKEKGPLQKELEKFGKSRKKFQFSDDFVTEFLKDAEELQALTPNSYAARRKMAELGRKVNRQIPSSIGEKLTTYLMDNMLGNFRTLITRNAGGNVGLNALEQLAQRPLAAGIDSLIARKTGQRTQAGLSREGLADYIHGFAKGIADEADDVRTGLHTARTGENTLGRAISANRHVFGEGRGLTGNTVLGRTLDRFDSLVKNGLSIGDRPFYEAVYKQTLGDYKRLRPQMGSEVGKLTDTQFKEYSEIAAKLNALSAVYQNDTMLSDALLKLKSGIGDLSRGILGFDILSQFSMPFVKTPANVVDVGISYSPLGLVRNAVRTGKEIHNNTFDQNRFANETSRNILGTALTAGGIGLAAAGAMSGKYSDDKDEKQAQKEAGEQEYALNTPLGQMDIGWSPVTGSNLVGAAAAYDAYKKGEGTPAQNAMEGVMAGGQALFDQSMFQGLQRLFGTGETYDSDEGIVGNMANVVKSGLTQFIPSLARQAGQVIDPYERDLGGSNKDVSFGPLDNYDINSLAKVVPFLRQNVLAPKVNTSGELMKENQGRNVGMKILEDMILPGKISQVDYPILSQEAIRLSNETGNKYSYLPKTSRQDVDTEDHVLSNQEWVDYQMKYYGELTNAGTQLLNSEVYKNADAETQESMLSNTYSALRSAINSEYNGKEVSGAAKKYVEAGGGDEGIKAVLDYVVAGNMFKSAGLSSTSKAAEEIKADISAGNIEAAQQKVQQYGENKEKLDALNQQYGYSMKMTDYLKKEATYEGGAEQWLKDRKAAEEAGIVNAAGQVQTDDYGKIMDQAGPQAAKMERDLPTLNGMDMPKSSYYTYAKAINVDPSLSPNEFAKTFNEIDTEHPNNKRSITMDEMLAYINNHNMTNESEVMKLWNMYAPEGKQVPYLKKDGTWGKHNPNK